MIMRTILAACLLALLAGCGTYDVQLDRGGRSLDGVQRYFVLGNPNDNRALDHRIVAALKARGYEAETGPLTMMSDDAQAIVSYQDRWSWDFGDRLVYLQIAVRDRKTGQTNATVQYHTRLPGGKPLPAIVDELVGRLVPDRKR